MGGACSTPGGDTKCVQNYVLERESEADTAQWYSARLRAELSGVRVAARAGNFSLHHLVQTGSGAHPASNPVGTRAISLDLNLTTHLHLVLMSRRRGAIPPRRNMP
jgi:hypothetical protein